MKCKECQKKDKYIRELMNTTDTLDALFNRLKDNHDRALRYIRRRR